METLLVLIFIFYFFSSRRITDDIFSINKFIAKSFCNVFLSFFRFLLNPIKSWFTRRKKTLFSSKGKESADSVEYKNIVEFNEKNKNTPEEPQRVAIQLPKTDYCLITEFHKRLENPLQRAVWKYYVDTNVSQGLRSNVVISLDKSATKPEQFDITADCLAMNLPLVWKIIQLEHRKLSSRGMIKVVLSLYGETNKKPA